MALYRDGAIITEHGQRYPANISKFEHVTDLAGRALLRGIGTLWLTGEDIPACASAWTMPREGWNIFVPAHKPPRSCDVRRLGTSEHVLIHWLDTKSPWAALAAAPDPLAAARYYREALHVAPGYSPGAAGLDLMDRIRLRNPDWWNPPALRRVTLPKAYDCLWVKATLDQHTPYLHKFDTNSAYLAVAETQAFGCGEPVRVDGDAHTAHAFACWNVHATAGRSLYTGIMAPWPWPGPKAGATFNGWAWGPQVDAARLAGWQVGIMEGLIWPQRHQLLRGWASDIWQARAVLAENRATYASARDAAAAVGAVKDTYRVALGRMGSPESAGKWYGRPDWHGYVMAECYRRQLAMIEAVYMATRLLPQSVYTDALVYASDTADPAAIVYDHPKRGRVPLMERSTGLGGWKHAGTVCNGEAIGALARAARQGMSAGEWMSQLNRAIEQGKEHAE